MDQVLARWDQQMLKNSQTLLKGIYVYSVKQQSEKNEPKQIRDSDEVGLYSISLNLPV